MCAAFRNTMGVYL
uniref:Uncharacterized protein n=1 Tax=Arundo donax TaxID=35708 RepID=A0A0A8Y6E1_ARUDO